MANYIRPFNCDYEAADNVVWISKPIFEFCSSVTGTDEAEGMVNYIRPFNCDFEAAANFVWIPQLEPQLYIFFRLYNSVTDEAKGDYEAAANFVWIPHLEPQFYTFFSAL